MSTTALLHIGSPKAGSSTIQNNLFSWREELKEASILIPEINGRRVNQVEIARMFENSDSTSEFSEVLSKVICDIRETSPKYVVFSSEYMWDNYSCIQDVKKILSPLCDDIRVIVYLREPVSYYLSSMQQQLKATDRLSDPVMWRASYREKLSAWRSEYEGKLNVIPFQPQSFPKGLTEEFLETFTGHKVLKSTSDLSRRSNTSEHAEVTYLMQKYFRYCYPDEPRTFRKEADLLRSALHNTSTFENLGKRAVLLPEVQRVILSNHRDELFWLRDEEGVEFESIDYEELQHVGGEGFPEGLRNFGDIVDINIEHSDEILMKSLRRLAEQGSRLAATQAELRKSSSELSKSRSDLVNAHSDISARRSKLAAKIDRLDYQSHLFLANLRFLSERFRTRMRVAADKRHRTIYDR